MGSCRTIRTTTRGSCARCCSGWTAGSRQAQRHPQAATRRSPRRRSSNAARSRSRAFPASPCRLACWRPRGSTTGRNSRRAACAPSSRQGSAPRSRCCCRRWTSTATKWTGCAHPSSRYRSRLTRAGASTTRGSAVTTSSSHCRVRSCRYRSTSSSVELNHDPRLSIAERYRDRDHYLDLIAEHARPLIAQGYARAEDLPQILERAREHWARLVDGR